MQYSEEVLERIEEIVQYSEVITINQIIFMYQNGFSIEEIADAMGTTERVIERALRGKNNSFYETKKL